MSKTAYRKVYALLPSGKAGYKVTVPALILERAARSKGMTLEQFVKTHKVVHLFNDFTGFDAAYRFEESPPEEVLELSGEEMEELDFEEPVPEVPVVDFYERLRQNLKGGS